VDSKLLVEGTVVNTEAGVFFFTPLVFEKVADKTLANADLLFHFFSSIARRNFLLETNTGDDRA
jgi:hypothetical protein